MRRALRFDWAADFLFGWQAIADQLKEMSLLTVVIVRGLGERVALAGIL